MVIHIVGALVSGLERYRAQILDRNDWFQLYTQGGSWQSKRHCAPGNARPENKMRGIRYPDGCVVAALVFVGVTYFEDVLMARHMFAAEAPACHPAVF